MLTIAPTQRFLEELKHLPPRIAIPGDGWRERLVRALFARHAPHRIVTETSTAADQELPSYCVMSMEEYGTALIRTMLEGTPPPGEHVLCWSIPDDALRTLAHEEGITPAPASNAPDDVAAMVARIAAAQPQTYASLAKSAQRLRTHTKHLRHEEPHAHKEQPPSPSQQHAPSEEHRT